MRTTILLAFTSSCTVLFAQPGVLDPTFGNGGITITAIASDNSADLVNDLLIQPDGKIIAVGTHSGTGWETVLARYHTDGTLDSTFGTNGIVTSDFGGDWEITTTGILTGSGGILICGSSDHHLMLARYLEDGTIDTGFSGDGVLIDDTWESSPGFGMTQQADGRLLVYGQRNEGDGIRLSVRRLNEDGTLDTSFDGDGYTMTDLPGVNDRPSSIAVQPDGKVVVAGSVGSINSLEGLALVRYNADGTLDSGFNGTGIWIYDNPDAYWELLSSVIIQTDGKILAAGSSSEGMDDRTVMVRLDQDGTPDPTFDGDGFLFDGPVTPAGWTELLQQPDGKLIAFGIAGDQIQFLIARYLLDGTLDQDFGTNGHTVTAVGGTAYASTCVLMNDGRILAAGAATPGNYQDLVLVCYQNDVGGIGVPEGGVLHAAMAAYPNPAREVVYLRPGSSTEEVLNGEVIDVQGRSLQPWTARATGEGTYAVDIARIPPGSYVLRCAMSSGNAHVRVVKY